MTRKLIYNKNGWRIVQQGTVTYIEHRCGRVFYAAQADKQQGYCLNCGAKIPTRVITTANLLNKPEGRFTVTTQPVRIKK